MLLACHFIGAINQNTDLKSLSLEGIFEPSVYKVFAEGLKKNTTLLRLNFWCSMCGESMNELSDALKVNTTVQKVMFSGEIEDTGWTAIAEALRVNKGIKKLRISHDGYYNFYHPAQCPFAEPLLNNTTLQELHLLTCNINDRWLNELLPTLKKNSSLRKLNLKGNLKITDVSAPLLAETMAENKSLTVIDLQYCSLNVRSAHILSASLKRNTVLKKLNLRYNFFAEALDLDPRVMYCRKKVQIPPPNDYRDRISELHRQRFLQQQDNDLHVFAIHNIREIVEKSSSSATSILVPLTINSPEIDITDMPELEDDPDTKQ